MSYLNLCRSCDRDFASVAAFDRHRIGKHAYTFTEGLALGREDGRRCMDETEMLAAGMESNERRRWGIAADAESIRQWREAATAQKPVSILSLQTCLGAV